MERVELLTLLEQRQAARASRPDVRATIFTRAPARRRRDAGAPPSGRTDEAGATPTSTPAAGRGTRSCSGSRRTRRSSPTSTQAEADRRAVLLFDRARSGGLVMPRACSGFRVERAQNLPTTGPFIICPNHQSYLDGFFLAAALPFRTLRGLFFVGAAEYLRDAVRCAWLARLINIVPVDPDANLVTAMRAGAAGLRLKKVLMLFPEGERRSTASSSRSGRARRFCRRTSTRRSCRSRSMACTICGRAAGRSTGAGCCRGGSRRSRCNSARHSRSRAATTPGHAGAERRG